MKNRSARLLAVCLALSPTAANAADTTAGVGVDMHDETQERKNEVVAGSKATLDNATFAQEAMETNLAAVELANLAPSKTESDSVKSFAEEMKTDHGNAQFRAGQDRGRARASPPRRRSIPSTSSSRTASPR